MDSPPEHISKPSAARSSGLNTAASKMGESRGPISREENQRTNAPSYRPPGYPDLGGLWTQPPQPLPGPEDHPFFKWVAEGAKKDPAILATTTKSVSTDRHAIQEMSSTSSAQSVIQPQAVYPFMPAPTAALEPFTPDATETKTFFEPSPSSNTTPDLSSSPTEPSPRSVHTVTPSRGDKNTSQVAEDIKKPDTSTPTSASNTDPEGANTVSRDPECTSTYMRLMTNSETHRPLAILNGQIWRSGSKRDGWRRHQWSVEAG